MLRCTSGLRHVLKTPPSSTALPPCLCLRPSQAPVTAPAAAHRPPPSVHQSAASSLSSPAEPSAHHSGVASTAALHITHHTSQPRHPRTAPPGPSPRPALTPRPSQLCSSGQSRFVSDKAAAVDAESHGQLPAASITKTPGSSPAPPRWVLAELG